MAGFMLEIFTCPDGKALGESYLPDWGFCPSETVRQPLKSGVDFDLVTSPQTQNVPCPVPLLNPRFVLAGKEDGKQILFLKVFILLIKNVSQLKDGLNIYVCVLNLCYRNSFWVAGE